MSDTPRTDAMSELMHPLHGVEAVRVVRLSRAQQLERELAAAKATIAQHTRRAEEVAIAVGSFWCRSDEAMVAKVRQAIFSVLDASSPRTPGLAWDFNDDEQRVDFADRVASLIIEPEGTLTGKPLNDSHASGSALKSASHDWQPDGGVLRFESHPGGEAPHVHTTCAKCGARAWFLEYQWELLAKGCASAACGCTETYPQLVAGKVSHGSGCARSAEVPRERALAEALQLVLDDWANGNTILDDAMDRAHAALSMPAEGTVYGTTLALRGAMRMRANIAWRAFYERAFGHVTEEEKQTFLDIVTDALVSAVRDNANAKLPEERNGT